MALTQEERRQLDRLVDLATRIDERCKGCQRVQAEHDVILHGPPGNGSRPGVLGRLSTAEDELKRLTERNEERRGWRIWAARATVSGVTALLGGLVAALAGKL